MANRNFFRPSREREQRYEKPMPSKAEALAISPPPLTAEQKAGQRAMNLLAAKQLAEKVESQERYESERAEYEAERDAAIWKGIEARRRAAV
jgi:hypothetical protein